MTVHFQLAAACIRRKETWRQSRNREEPKGGDPVDNEQNDGETDASGLPGTYPFTFSFSSSVAIYNLIDLKRRTRRADTKRGRTRVAALKIF